MQTEIDKLAFTRVDTPSNIPLGTSILIQIGDVTVSVWHLNDGFFAIEDECPHKGDSLSLGRFEGDGVIACPWHGSQFEIRTGKVISLPATCGVRTYPVEIIDGDIYVSKKPHNDAKPQLFELR